MRKIFLSFCGANRQEKNEIKEYLLAQKKDYTVYESDEFCTSDFSSECIEKIDESQIFVAIVSKETMKGSYCKNEIIHARKLERLGKLNILLFKLFDGEFTPDFEFQLNGYTDVNNLYRGTKEGYIRLEEKIEYLLKCREEGKPQYEALCDTLSLNHLHPLDEGIQIASNDEIEKIAEGFAKNNVVFLRGAVGIGKMFTARAYFAKNKHLKAYRASGKGIRDLIASIDIGAVPENRTETNEDIKYARNIKVLQRFSPNVLVVANNLPIGDIDSELIEDLNKIGLKLLITTSENPCTNAFPVVEIDHFSENKLLDLFFSVYGDGEREMLTPHITELIKKVGYHTGTVAFIATKFNEWHNDANDIIEKINSLDLEDSDFGTIAEAAMAKFFKVDTLTESEKDILFFVANSAGMYSAISDIKLEFKKVGIKDLDAVTSLIKKGYLREEGKHAVSVSETVAIVALNIIEPSDIAKRTTLSMLFGAFSATLTQKTLDAINDFASRYTVPNFDMFTECCNAWKRLVAKYDDNNISAFFQTCVNLRDLQNDDIGLVEGVRMFLSTATSLYIVDEYFLAEAERNGIYEFIFEDGSDYENDEESDEIVQSFAEIISVIVRISRSSNASAEDIEFIRSYIPNLYMMIVKSILISEDEKLSEMDWMAIQALLTAMEFVGDYAGIITFINKNRGSMAWQNEALASVANRFLLIVLFYAHLRSGIEGAYEIALEAYEASGTTIYSDSLIKEVCLYLLRKDVENGNYKDAQRRIDKLASLSGLTVEDQLYICLKQASVELFGMNWYRLRDFLANTLERYGEYKSDYIEQLKSAYEDCLAVIEDIENSEDVITNERDIVAASDYDVYSKYLQKQVGNAVFKSCNNISEIALNKDFSLVTDEQLAALAAEISQEMKKSSKQTDEQIGTVFALVREAGCRVLGIKHHKIQLIAAALMVKGYSAQIRNGEGKTYTIVAAATALALSGRQVDVVSSGEYLAERDYKWMGEIYRMLGISVKHFSELENGTKPQVVYWTAMRLLLEQTRYKSSFKRRTADTKVCDTAIVDEADLILIDDRLPPTYIILNKKDMGRISVAQVIYKMLQKGVINQEDYTVNEDGVIKIFATALTKLSKQFGISVQDSRINEYREMLIICIKMVYIWKSGEDYIIRDNNFYMENLKTGQSFKLSGDYYIFLAIKEGISIEKSVNTKNMYVSCLGMLFKEYRTLIGTSGTMMAAKNIFRDYYGIECVDVPTNKKITRIDRGYKLYSGFDTQINAIIEQIVLRRENGQPVLIVAPDSKRLQKIKNALDRAGIEHNYIGYQNEEEAAKVFAVAGLRGAVTLSTNIAGRGIDILLGGNPKFSAIEKMKSQGYTKEDIELSQTANKTDDRRTVMLRNVYKSIFAKEKEISDEQKELVLDAGGLAVIGTFLMGSLRHEEQICGRAGRQGEPGESEFIVSLDDENISVYFGIRLYGYFKSILSDGYVDGGIITKTLRRVQIKREESVAEFKTKNEILFDICESFYEYTQRILSDDLLLAQRIYDAAHRTSEHIDKKPWREQIRALPVVNIRRFFRKRTVIPDLQTLLTQVNPSATKAVFEILFADTVQKTLVSYIEYFENHYSSELRKSEINDTQYSKFLKEFELDIMKITESIIDGLVENTCIILSSKLIKASTT